MTAGLLTPRQAAEALGVSLRTLGRLRAEGVLPALDLAAVRESDPDGRAVYRYDPADIAAFLARARKGAQCRSTDPKPRRIGTMTSKSGVYDFTAARERRLAARRSGSKPGSGNAQP